MSTTNQAKRLTVAQLAAIVETQGTMIAELQAKVTELEATPKRSTTKGERDYGPSSETSMSPSIAQRILWGDMRKLSVRDVADKMGLSRGQVYSLKGRYTLKETWKQADAVAKGIKDGEFTADEAADALAQRHAEAAMKADWVQ